MRAWKRTSSGRAEKIVRPMYRCVRWAAPSSRASSAGGRRRSGWVAASVSTRYGPESEGEGRVARAHQRLGTRRRGLSGVKGPAADVVATARMARAIARTRAPSGVDRDLRRPQRVSAFEGVRVGSDARARGQGPELPGVAAAQHDVLRKERATKQRDDGQNVLSPALVAQTPAALVSRRSPRTCGLCGTGGAQPRGARGCRSAPARSRGPCRCPGKACARGERRQPPASRHR